MPDKDALLEKLRVHFVKNNQAKCAEILEALESGDTRLAYRLAHTLKGSAAMIGKTGLQRAAGAVTDQLRDGNGPIPDDSLETLKAELASALEELKPLLDVAPAWAGQPLDTGEITALFEKLEPMLANFNPECLDLLDDIRRIPGTEELAHWMEEYDFPPAARALAEIRRKLWLYHE